MTNGRESSVAKHKHKHTNTQAKRAVPSNQAWFIQRMKTLGYKVESDGFCLAVESMGRAAILTEHDDPESIATFNARFRQIAAIPVDQGYSLELMYDNVPIPAMMERNKLYLYRVIDSLEYAVKDQRGVIHRHKISDELDESFKESVTRVLWDKYRRQKLSDEEKRALFEVTGKLGYAQNQFAQKIDDVKLKFIKLIAKVKAEELMKKKLTVSDLAALTPEKRKEFNREVQEKIEKLREQLPEDERIILDIPTFFDGLEIYQELQLYSDLVENKNVPDASVARNKLASSLVTSKSLEKLGGELRIDSHRFSGAYTTEELTTYFETLRYALKRDPPFDCPIALELKSSNHAITVGYNPKKRRWIFIDANKLPAKYIYDDKEIAEKVASAFFSTKQTIISTEIFIAKDPKKWAKNKNLKKEEAEELIKNHEENFKKHLSYWKHDNEFEKIQKITTDKAKMLDENNSSWLLMEAELGRLEEVKKLLKHGADPNIKIKTGMTPLYSAVKEGHLEVVRELLKHNADPNVKNDKGLTPLHIAARQGDLKLVQELLKYDADPRIKTKEGLTALDRAISNGHPQVAKELLQNKRVKTRRYKENIRITASLGGIICAVGIGLILVLPPLGISMITCGLVLGIVGGVAFTKFFDRYDIYQATKASSAKKIDLTTQETASTINAKTSRLKASNAKKGQGTKDILKRVRDGKPMSQAKNPIDNMSKSEKLTSTRQARPHAKVHASKEEIPLQRIIRKVP